MKSKENINIEETTEEVNIKETTEEVKASENLSKSEDAPESAKEETFHGEDSLEISQLKGFKKLKAKRAKIKENTKDMTFSQKLGYYTTYYKWPVIVTLSIIVALCLIIYSLYKNSRPVAISMAVINNYDEENINYDVLDDYMSYYDFDSKKYQKLTSEYAYLDLSTYDKDYAANPESANFSQLPNLCYNGYFDIIIGNKVGIKYCAAMGLIQPIESVLYPDVRKIVDEKYSDRILSCENASTVTKNFGIDISDTDFAKSLNLEYDDVYIAFVGQTDTNLSNARLILGYIFKMGLTRE